MDMKALSISALPGAPNKNNPDKAGLFKHLKLIKPYQTKNLHLYYLTLIEPFIDSNLVI